MYVYKIIFIYVGLEIISNLLFYRYVKKGRQIFHKKYEFKNVSLHILHRYFFYVTSVILPCINWEILTDISLRFARKLIFIYANIGELHFLHKYLNKNIYTLKIF